MVRSLAFAFVLALAAPAVRAQTIPAVAAEDAGLAERLRSVAALSPRDARAALAARAGADEPSCDLLSAFEHAELRAAILTRLASADPDGSLRERFPHPPARRRRARRGAAAIAKIGDKALEPLPGSASSFISPASFSL